MTLQRCCNDIVAMLCVWWRCVFAGLLSFEEFQWNQNTIFFSFMHSLFPRATITDFIFKILFNLYCLSALTCLFFLDEDECMIFSPCKNGAQCINEVGNYRCICTKGWTGQNCTQGKKTSAIKIFSNGREIWDMLWGNSEDYDQLTHLCCCGLHCLSIPLSLNICHILTHYHTCPKVWTSPWLLDEIPEML